MAPDLCIILGNPGRGLLDVTREHLDKKIEHDYSPFAACSASIRFLHYKKGHSPLIRTASR